ncbi:MAG: yliI 2 [Gemmataceae bacterium]|nr:yliI 2 [Gemmataceae bacterium]
MSVLRFSPARHSRFLGLGLMGAVTVASVWPGSRAGEPGRATPEAPPARKPWTTSKVVGSPDPPPAFKSVRVFPNVKFHHPLLIARCPGTDRLFVGEQEGVLYSIANRPDARADVFFDLRKELKAIDKTPGAKDVEAVYGLVFHPKFEQNRFCYVCYTLRAKDGSVSNLPDGSRVSRFTVTNTDPPRIDPASEEIVIAFLQGGHNGGDIHFGPDGMLYISTGDAANPNPPDRLNTGQDCSDLLSSVLRIDVDRKDPGKNYAVPKDNPFVTLPGVKPEIWAYGFRNPWRMSFDRKTGDLWLGDVGWELWEMVHRIEKGGNYGWSIVEGRQPIKPTQKPGPTPIRPPTIDLPHTIAASVTGGYVYRGKKFPELVGAYVFGDWETRRIWAARFDGDRVKEMPELVKPTARVVAFGEDHAGELYFLDYDTGLMYTLERNASAGKNADFPTKLSETGLFSSVGDHKLAEGVIPFRPNVEQWQDTAAAEWWIALPGLSSVKLFEKPRPLPGFVDWHAFRMQFPKDAVLVKTLSLAVAGRKERTRVETQLLHFDGDDWRGYSYAWRDDQADADLVPAEGTEKLFPVLTAAAPDAGREQVWTFHSRTQCMSCHNAWAEFTLAFSPAQLNRPDEGGHSLAAFTQRGIVRRMGEKDNILAPFDEASAAKELKLVPPFVTSAGNLDQRARSYLHVNCSHCHRFGGGGGAVVLELDAFKSLKETGALDTRPKQGDFSLADPKLIAPGAPARSVLYYRMAKFGRGRMPHLGSEWPHPDAVDLIGEWIGSLGGKEYPPRAADATGAETRLAAVDTALPLARALGGGRLDRPERVKVVGAAGKLSAGPVRDLFEGYLPPDPKGRKLGSNPRPATVLGLKGDAKRGEGVFFTESVQCAKCHKVGDRGVALGPDLSAVGKTRTRAELLESVLEPSRRVEPQYAAYLVRTADGQSLTGLLVKRDEKQVVLRDAENKEITLAAGDVETVQPSRLSLMPDGLAAGLTPQEAADLLEFLATRK